MTFKETLRLMATMEKYHLTQADISKIMKIRQPSLSSRIKTVKNYFDDNLDNMVANTEPFDLDELEQGIQKLDEIPVKENLGNETPIQEPEEPKTCPRCNGEVSELSDSLKQKYHVNYYCENCEIGVDFD